MKKVWKNVLGFLILFVTVMLVASVSIVSYKIIDEKFEHNTLLIALLVFVIIIFFTTAYATIDYFRRKIMVDSPSQEILQATNKITKGDFSVRLTPKHTSKNYDEFDIIKLHLNTMTEELSKNEILNNNFIANISHEIKTPLAVIQNYATALQTPNLTEEERKEYSKILIDTTKKMTDLVSNILKLNKLENQKILPDMKEINATETVRESTLNFVEKIDEKNINLLLDLDEIQLFTDKGMFEIVVNNLISNAVKFTKNEIFISLKNEKNFVVLKVKDNGIGMNEEVGNHIFDKFYQGETSHSVEGNGLGLALVKKVIDILGGEISVTSEENKGSEFAVKFKK